jgi:hypothetical protein
MPLKDVVVWDTTLCGSSKNLHYILHCDRRENMPVHSILPSYIFMLLFSWHPEIYLSAASNKILSQFTIPIHSVIHAIVHNNCIQNYWDFALLFWVLHKDLNSFTEPK